MLVLGSFLFQHRWEKSRVNGWMWVLVGSISQHRWKKSQGWGPAFPLVDSGRVVLEGFIFQLSWKKKSRVKG